MSSAPVARGPVDELAAAVDDVLVSVRLELDAVIDVRRDLAARRGEPCARLWTDLGTGVGGKLLRPRLLAASYLGLGGADPESVVRPAAAVELLHAAMLVHDDLLDHDEVRRGRLNVAGATRARLVDRGVAPHRIGDQVVAAAVLAGDAGIAGTFRLLAAAPVDAGTRVRLVELVGDAIETTVSGELLDVVAELAAPADVDALLVAELKTAAYSTRLPLLAGAILAGRTDRWLPLERIGVALGVAYQLVDDVIGVFGDPAVSGKSVLSDLRDGKRTLLLRTAWERADAADRRTLGRAVGRADLDELGAARVRAVLRGTGALATVEAHAATLVDTARRLAATELPPALAELLGDVADELTARQR